jgi:hypothetical protein
LTDQKDLSVKKFKNEDEKMIASFIEEEEKLLIINQ